MAITAMVRTYSVMLWPDERFKAIASPEPGARIILPPEPANPLKPGRTAPSGEKNLSHQWVETGVKPAMYNGLPGVGRGMESASINVGNCDRIRQSGVPE